tara:strand:- start:3393 stop:4430 length:1038 start_codon:yes stop_codon:yes gene_type:complete
MSLNKVITSVNALVNSVSIPSTELNNVVCIDTVNNRIGVKTANPEKEIDISGMLKTNYLYINNENNDISGFDISYDKSFITLSRGIKINEDISCENLVCEEICCNLIDVSGIYGDVSFYSFVDISGRLNLRDELIVDSSLTVLRDASFNKNIQVKGDASLNGDVGIYGTLNAIDINHSGQLTQTSDDRYKHNEKIINNGLEIIRQLEPQVYDKTSTFKDENYRGIVNEPYFVEAGLIAQEVFIINDLSFTVREGNSVKPYYVNYNNIFTYGLAGIKELDKIVHNKIVNDISNLSDRISRINEGTPDISDINLSNMKNFIVSQNTVIQGLNRKIENLERRINNLEK